MIHHHSSGKRRLWKRIFSMCIALILICGMTVPASSVSASQEMAGTVEEQTLKDESGQTTDVLSADSESSDQQQVSDSGSGTSEDQSEDENEDQILSDEQTDTDMTDETEETTTENSGDSNSTQPEETKPETPENGEQTGTEEDKGTDGALTEDETGEGDTVASDGTEADEGETEETVTYEQAARAALALYGEEAAFRDGEVITDAQKYFTISGAGDNVLEDFDVTAGEIDENSVPVINDYDFINATVGDDNIEVESVGILTIDGETTYIFYTTAGSSSGLAAMVLGEGEKITLNYEPHREEYTITYEVTGAGNISEDEIFGTDRPTTVEDGDSYAFRVTIPRGYTAEVSVNGVSQGSVGTEPTYTGDDSVISVVGEPTELTLSDIYEISNVQGNQTVTVSLTRRTSYTFSAELWTKTRYASDNGSPRANFGTTKDTFSASSLEEDGNSTEVWEFTTNEVELEQGGTIWILDSLQMNGTDLEVPYLDNDAHNQSTRSTTVLPSGTVATITVRVNYEEYTTGWWPFEETHYTLSRTYTVSVSNCYENITITGGNLYGDSWKEIMVNRLTGVELQVYDHQSTATTYNQWKSIKQSEPFGVGYESDENASDKNYWFGTEGLRFRLVPGYVNPTITYGTAQGIDKNDLGQYIGEVSAPNEDGWYTFSIDSQGDNNYTMLRIEAELGKYDVSYNAGDYAVDDTTGTPTLPPYDNGDYNVIDNSQIIVSSIIPVDETNKNVFDYWTLEGYVDDEGNLIQIHPNEILNLSEVAEHAEYIDGQYVLPLEANWVDATTAEQITYSIEFILVNENGDKTTVKVGDYQAPRGSTIVLNTSAEEIADFLAEHPDYVLDEERTKRYYDDVQAGEVLEVYFIKAITDVTITKEVTGSFGDTQKEFQFSYTIGSGEHANFSLKDDGTYTFEDVKIGETLRFKETNANDYEITVTYTDADTEPGDEATTLIAGSDGFYEIEVTKGLSITVTNYKSDTPDTGIHLTSWPYILTLTFVSVGAVTLGVCKCRKRHD